MLSRGVAMSLGLLLPTIVQAGAVIELRPVVSTNVYNPCGTYLRGETVTVEVYASQSPAGNLELLRLVQLDFTDSDPSLVLPATVTWAATTNHFAFLADDGGTAKRLSNTFHGNTAIPDLGPNASEQLNLLGDGTCVKLGEFDVRMPTTSGTFLLDVMNATSTDADRGAQIRFGFSLGGTSPITAWRADTSDLTGGTYSFDVIDQAVVTTAPGDGGSLPSTDTNHILIDFDRAVGPNGPINLIGLVQIKELRADCGLGGTDLAAGGDFAFSLENGGTTLRIIESSTRQLTDGTWYGVVNAAWPGVPAFKVDLVALQGDVNGSLFTDFGDVSSLLAVINDGAATDANRRADVDGSGFIDFGDVSALLANIDTGTPAKPSGHDSTTSTLCGP